MHTLQKKIMLILLILLPFALSAQVPVAATDSAKKTQSEKPIRVGLIGCDTHGMYYGPQMQEHDPILFSLPVPMDQPAPYTWMRGGIHYYLYTYYPDPTRMTAPFVEGFEIVKLWDKDRGAAEVAAKILNSSPEVCEFFEQVSDDVDLVFIADCNGDGHDHLKLATPGLKKGIPTFVDKPFASSLADVLAMLKLSKEYDAPIMSLSILQTVPETRQFARRLEEIGGAHFGTIQGESTNRAALIHTICIALTVFGSDVESVRALTGPNHTSIHLDWGGQPNRPSHGVMINCDTGRGWHCSMYISALGPGGRGVIYSQGIGDWEFPQGSAEILRLIKKMVETGKSQGPVNQMIEAVAIADAADAAIKAGATQPFEMVKPVPNLNTK